MLIQANSFRLTSNQTKNILQGYTSLHTNKVMLTKKSADFKCKTSQHLFFIIFGPFWGRVILPILILILKIWPYEY